MKDLRRLAMALAGLVLVGLALAVAPAVAQAPAATPAATPAAAPAASAAPAPAPSPSLEWKSADGKNALKVGLLGQAQLESIDDTIGGDSQDNLFLRRLRLIFGYTLGDKLSVFVETDNPNLGKGDGAGGKNEVDMFIQDFVATWNFSNAFKLDGGLFLTAQSYNHNQSAATLMALDYGAATFVESTPLRSKVGRDYGLQARGYLAGDKVEYRLAVTQGVRGRRPVAGGDFHENDFRYLGRLMYWIAGPQKGLFYRGTSLGKTKSAAVAVSFDTQEDYDNVGADFFWDQPLAGGNGITFQADYNDIDGGGFVALPEQTTAMAEVGYYIASVKLLPYVHYSQQDFDSGADITWSEVGVGRYFRGHNANLKLAFTRIERDGSRDRDQIRLQWQVFAF
jgi:hypothetical protein